MDNRDDIFEALVAALHDRHSRTKRRGSKKRLRRMVRTIDVILNTVETPSTMTPTPHEVEVLTQRAEVLVEQIRPILAGQDAIVGAALGELSAILIA